MPVMAKYNADAILQLQLIYYAQLLRKTMHMQHKVKVDVA